MPAHLVAGHATAGGVALSAAPDRRGLLDSSLGESGRIVDFDLHGLVGVRLINPSLSDVAAVERQLGPLQRRLQRHPDIAIRFVKQLPMRGELRLLGRDEAGFTDDAFVIMRGKHKSAVKVQIPFDAIGECCELECESGLLAVPLLMPLINITALARGAVAVHASAFVYHGVGVLVTGWAQGGKTEALLGFAANGAQYIGDEWVYVDSTGQKMYGIPEPVHIWDWQVEQLPQFRDAVGRGNRLKWWPIQWLTAILSGARWVIGRNRLAGGAWIPRLQELLHRARRIAVPPQRLFGAELGPLTAPLDKIILIMSHAAPDITVAPIDPLEVADRIAASLQQERTPFLSMYQMFRFAFPQRTCTLIDELDQLQRARLAELFAGKSAYVVRHPYPVSLNRLFESIRQVL